MAFLKAFACSFLSVASAVHLSDPRSNNFFSFARKLYQRRETGIEESSICIESNATVLFPLSGRLELLYPLHFPFFELDFVHKPLWKWLCNACAAWLSRTHYWLLMFGERQLLFQ